MVRHVRGVIGITNNILVSPPASPDKIQDEIDEAFRREAEVDARHISVDVTDHTARPNGHAHSLSEASRRGGSCRARSRRGGKPPGGLAVARERLPAVIRIPCLAAAGGPDRDLPGAGARGQPTNAWPQQDPSRRALAWRDTRAAGVMSSRALRRTATPGLRTREMRMAARG